MNINLPVPESHFSNLIVNHRKNIIKHIITSSNIRCVYRPLVKVIKGFIKPLPKTAILILNRPIPPRREDKYSGWQPYRNLWIFARSDKKVQTNRPDNVWASPASWSLVSKLIHSLNHLSKKKLTAGPHTMLDSFAWFLCFQTVGDGMANIYKTHIPNKKKLSVAAQQTHRPCGVCAYKREHPLIQTDDTYPLEYNVKRISF